MWSRKTLSYSTHFTELTTNKTSCSHHHVQRIRRSRSSRACPAGRARSQFVPEEAGHQRFQHWNFWSVNLNLQSSPFHALSVWEKSRADTPIPIVEESGIDTNATTKYPGATVRTGASASGREIAPDEGGDIISRPGEKGGSGRVTKDVDFEGEGGPETKQRRYEEENPGNDDVESNVNQKNKPEGDTVPTNFGGNIVGKQM